VVASRACCSLPILLPTQPCPFRPRGLLVYFLSLMIRRLLAQGVRPSRRLQRFWNSRRGPRREAVRGLLAEDLPELLPSRCVRRLYDEFGMTIAPCF